MKKIIFIISFLVCAFISKAQFPNNVSVSNAQTIYHIKGAVKGDVSLMLPVVDTLNNPATPYPGALTIRPQDTIGHAIFSIYQSNGIYWSKVSSSIFIVGLGVDSVTLYNGELCQWQGGIKTCYFLDPSVGDSDSLALSADSLWIYHYRNGALRSDSIFLLHTYLNVAPPHFSITYNYGGDPYSILLNAQKLVDSVYSSPFGTNFNYISYAHGRTDSVAVGGSTPNLQQVTDVGNITTRSIYVDSLIGTSDANIHGLTVGRGLGNVATNTVVGLLAGSDMTSAINDVFLGVSAGDSTTTGGNNVFIGFEAGKGNKTNGRGVFIGTQSGSKNTVDFNTFVGYRSGPNVTTGANNSFFGNSSGSSATTGFNNTFIGSSSGATTTGWGNTAVGARSYGGSTTGVGNTAVGDSALTQNSTGNYNTVLGYYAGLHIQTGSNNIAIGDSALIFTNAATGIGNLNIGIGHNASVATSSSTNGIAIGTNAIAISRQLAISDSITGMKFKNLDSAAGTAPSVIGKDGAGIWHVYQTPAGGGGSVLTVTGDLVDNTDPTNPVVGLTGTHTLLGNATVDMDGNSFRIEEAGNEFLSINPATFFSKLSATDGTANVHFQSVADLGGSSVNFQIRADDGSANEAVIDGDGLTGGIRYQAEGTGHNFVGLVRAEDYGTGAITGTPTFGAAFDGSGNVIEVALGIGTVTSVAALTLGTTGTDLSSSVANGTTTPVITLNVPTASASNRGALSSADWSTFNNKLSTASGWNIAGNALGAEGTFGSTTNHGISFKTNGIERMGIGGNTGKGGQRTVGIGNNYRNDPSPNNSAALLWDTITYSPTVVGLTHWVGMDVVEDVAKVSGGSEDDAIFGFASEAGIRATNTSNWVGTYGLQAVRGSVHIAAGATGTITNAFGVIGTGHLDAMTITNRYGIYSENPFRPGGHTNVTTNNYGLYVQSQTIGTTNWNIFSEGSGTTGRNYFGGRVGVNTLTPATLLDVGSASGVDALGIAGYSVFKWTVNDLYFGGFNASQWQNIRVSTAGTERIRIDSVGKVGIGTTTPYSKLSIKQSINNLTGGLSIQRLADDAGFYIGHDGTQSTLSSSYNTTGAYTPLAFLTSGLVRVTVANDGNVAISSAAPAASAQLDVVSTTKGFLPPRMTATQASAISSPAEGLLVYVTNTNGTFLAKGWWGWDGAAWQKLNN